MLPALSRVLLSRTCTTKRRLRCRHARAMQESALGTLEINGKAYDLNVPPDMPALRGAAPRDIAKGAPSATTSNPVPACRTSVVRCAPCPLPPRVPRRGEARSAAFTDEQTGLT